MYLKAIINPITGRKAMRRVTEEVVARLTHDGLLKQSDIHYISIDATQKVDEGFFDGCDMLMVAGGDGTLHHVINDLINAGISVPIAYLPTGTTNDFGHSMNLPRTADGFYQMLKNAKKQVLDVGFTGEAYFHYVLAGGFVSAISYTTSQRLKNRIGILAYVLTAAKRLRRYLPSTKIHISSAEVDTDEEALAFFVSNTNRIGGFSKMLPEAKADDGYLHVLVVRKTSFFALPSLLVDILRGTHGKRKDILLFKTKKVSITGGDDDGAIGMDGESAGTLPVTASVIHGTLNLIVP